MIDPARKKVYNRRYYLKHQKERCMHDRRYRERNAWLLMNRPGFTLDMRDAGLCVVTLHELRSPTFRFVYHGTSRIDRLEAL